MISSTALPLFLGVLTSTQILIFFLLRQSSTHIINHLHDLLTVLEPLRIDVPQLRNAYEQGYKAGILEQSRRQNEELNATKPPKSQADAPGSA